MVPKKNRPTSPPFGIPTVKWRPLPTLPKRPDHGVETRQKINSPEKNRPTSPFSGIPTVYLRELTQTISLSSSLANKRKKNSWFWIHPFWIQNCSDAGGNGQSFHQLTSQQFQILDLSVGVKLIQCLAQAVGGELTNSLRKQFLHFPKMWLTSQRKAMLTCDFVWLIS